MLQMTYKSPLFIPIFSSLIFLSGCSSPIKEVSTTHLYNNNYGVVSDPTTDAIIAEEIRDQDKPVTIAYQLDDPSYTTKLRRDSDAFLAEEWVEPEPIITYKYDDDPKFYREDELPENKLKLGDVIVKVPEGTDQATLLQGIERASTPQSGY